MRFTIISSNHYMWALGQDTTFWGSPTTQIQMPTQ